MDWGGHDCWWEAVVNDGGKMVERELELPEAML